jgi:segregation and condensation protein A
MFFGEGVHAAEPIFVPPKDLSLASLQEAAARALQNAPKPAVPRDEVLVQTVMSLEDMMGRLSERIATAMQMTFRDFTGAGADKRELVVSFLAMLELVKRGLLLVDQNDRFGEITMNYNGEAAVPRFE